MITDDLRTLLTHTLAQTQPLELLQITQEENHVRIVVVSTLFSGMTRVKRQQTVYQPLLTHFAEKQIHALTINAFTPQEWQRRRLLA
jgi:acid stress-induced BolA-like protein IbaG/YrbA